MTTIYREPEIQVSYDEQEDEIIVYLGTLRARITIQSEQVSLEFERALGQARLAMSLARRRERMKKNRG